MVGRRDDDSDFEEFVVACWPRLRRAAYLLTGGHADAEDLAQTALARTYAAWPRVRRDDAFAYARKVMVNANVDRFRRRRSCVGAGGCAGGGLAWAQPPLHAAWRSRSRSPRT